MKAVMYGGGNIGRGFIGALFSQGGYEVIFIDVSDQVVNALHREKSYPVRIVSNESYEDIVISCVDAIHGNDTDAVAASIAEADLMATAVGVGALEHIIPNLVAGLKLRFKQTDQPLDIIICENLMDANRIIEGMIKALLTEDEKILFDERVGLVEASIGRMVPVQTTQMQEGNHLRVCVEAYGYLPVDGAAFKGTIPALANLVIVPPFSFYIKRKLFIHNMGHALCAYLGKSSGVEYIYQSIDDPQIHLIVKNAMLESAQALSLAYDCSFTNLLNHIDDLLFRLTNQALRDTCDRVGKDPRRKLGAFDRLIGSANLCIEHGICPAHIAVGAGGALYFLIAEMELEQGNKQALKILHEVSGLNSEKQLSKMILEMYGLYLRHASPDKLGKAAQRIKHTSLGSVV